ncbi:hypothetical protein JCM18382A_26850 [Bradyrhizobium sp. 17-4]
MASANWRAGAGNALRIASHVALVTKVIGVTAVVGAVSNTDGMRLSAVLASLLVTNTAFAADGSARRGRRELRLEPGVPIADHAS